MFKKLIKEEFLKYGLDIGAFMISGNELRFSLKHSYHVNLGAYKIVVIKHIDGETDEYLEIHYTNIRYRKVNGAFIILTYPKYNYPKDIQSLVSLIKELEGLDKLYDYVKKIMNSIET